MLPQVAAISQHFLHYLENQFYSILASTHKFLIKICPGGFWLNSQSVWSHLMIPICCINILICQMSPKTSCSTFTVVLLMHFVSDQEAASGAGGSPHAQRGADRHAAACPAQQLRWHGSGTGGSLLCPGDTLDYSQQQHMSFCLFVFAKSTGATGSLVFASSLLLRVVTF